MASLSMAYLNGNKLVMNKRTLVISVDTKANIRSSFQFIILMGT
jgi:hypothetical protein